VEVLDFSDEIVKTDIGGYLVPRLYVTAVAVGEIVYELPSESLKELFIRLQRENVFTQSRI